MPDRNQPVQVFFFDRPNEAFAYALGIRGARGRKDDLDARVSESTPHVITSFSDPDRRSRLAVRGT